MLPVESSCGNAGGIVEHAGKKGCSKVVSKTKRNRDLQGEMHVLCKVTLPAQGRSTTCSVWSLHDLRTFLRSC